MESGNGGVWPSFTNEDSVQPGFFDERQGVPGDDDFQPASGPPPVPMDTGELEPLPLPPPPGNWLVERVEANERQLQEISGQLSAIVGILYTSMGGTSPPLIDYVNNTARIVNKIDADIATIQNFMNASSKQIAGNSKSIKENSGGIDAIEKNVQSLNNRYMPRIRDVEGKFSSLATAISQLEVKMTKMAIEPVADIRRATEGIKRSLENSNIEIERNRRAIIRNAQALAASRNLKETIDSLGDRIAELEDELNEVVVGPVGRVAAGQQRLEDVIGRVSQAFSRRDRISKAYRDGINNSLEVLDKKVAAIRNAPQGAIDEAVRREIARYFGGVDNLALGDDRDEDELLRRYGEASGNNNNNNNNVDGELTVPAEYFFSDSE